MAAVKVECELGVGRQKGSYQFRRMDRGWWSAWKVGRIDPYLVNLNTPSCTCKAGSFQKPCKHLLKARELETQFMSTTAPPPLWPQPIPILGLTGEYQSGKTFFGLSISPDPKRLRVYDFELSATPYRSLGFDYVNVAEVMAAKYPKGPKPIDVWNWWLEDVSALPTGKYDVILADPVTDLERGLADWVTVNPQHFGHTANQYSQMSGIMWGDLKDYWKLILSTRVATKCQTFAFVAHLGDEFKDKKPTGKRQPKGKDTLAELSTLYLWLTRDKNPDGTMQAAPAAEVIKTRLSHLGMGPDGPTIRAALPPRIPVATPKAIRDYLLNPPDYTNLLPGERAPERVLSADERLQLEVRKAEAMRDAAALQTPPTNGTAASPPAGIAPASPPPPESPPPPPPPPPAPKVFDRAKAVKLTQELAIELRLPPDKFAAGLNGAYGKQQIDNLNEEELRDLYKRLAQKIAEQKAVAAVGAK